MTKKKFIKTLRSWKAPEPVIKHCTNMVSHYLGEVSYDDVYKMLIKKISTEIIKNQTFFEYDVKTVNLGEASNDKYFLTSAYGVKVIEPSYMVDIHYC